MRSNATPENSQTTLVYTPIPVAGSQKNPGQLQLFDGPAEVAVDKNLATKPISKFLKTQVQLIIPQNPADIVIPPNINVRGQDPELLQNAIVAAFNHKLSDDAYMLSPTTYEDGEDLDENKFIVVKQNGSAQLITKRHKLLVPKDNKNIKTEFVKECSLKDTYFGAGFMHVLVVPEDSYALVTIDNKKQIYAPGIHVIEGAAVSFDKNTGFVKISEEFISHGNYHILRVAADKVAKVTIKNEKYFLEPRNDPYAYDIAPQDFKFDGCVSSRTNLISYDNLVRLTPALDQITVITLQGVRHYLAADPEDDNPRFFDEPLDAIGFMTTGDQQLIIPTKDAINGKYKMFPFAEAVSLGVNLDIRYKVSSPQRFCSDIIDIELYLDAQLATHIEEKCFFAITQILHQFFPQKSANYSITNDDLGLIKKVFIEQAKPQIEKKLGILIAEVVLTLDAFQVKEVNAPDTVIVSGGAPYSAKNPSLLFAATELKKDDKPNADDHKPGDHKKSTTTKQPHHAL